MNCITMLLKTSEIMAVRREIFAAGADRVVVFPLPEQAQSVHFKDWYFGKSDSRYDAPIKIDVGVDEDHTDAVISAFLRTAHVGKIGRIVRRPSKSKGVSLGMLHAA